MKFSAMTKRERTLFVVGAIFVGLGVLALLGAYANWWIDAVDVLLRVTRVSIPLALVAIGIYVVWGTHTGRFDNTLHRVGRADSLTLSSSDKRIMGVCGGIAQYFGIDSTSVRILAVLLLIASHLVTFVAYLTLGVVLPKQ